MIISGIDTLILRRGDNREFGFIRTGIRITSITVGGQAERDGGIHVGDEILAINHREITGTDDIGSIIQNSGQFMTLTVRRAGNILYMYVEVLIQLNSMILLFLIILSRQILNFLQIFMIVG